MMKITLDLETNDILVPSNFFTDVAKENEIIEAHGGTPVAPVERIKKSFEAAMSNTDKHLKTKKKAVRGKKDKDTKEE